MCHTTLTQTPTYEDMLRLTALFGPVKPPVASAQDIEEAGGITRVGEAECICKEGERCLVCLADYVQGEETRQLGSCQHAYHKGCIDEWLTTASNTCCASKATSCCRQRRLEIVRIVCPARFRVANLELTWIVGNTQLESKSACQSLAPVPASAAQ